MEASAYVSGRPHPRLAGLVLGYTGYRELSARPVRRREAPNGRCVLVLGLGPPIRLLGPAGPDVPTSFLAGMHDTPVITEFTGAQHGVQVDLTPLGVFTLLGRPMPELTNRAPRLDQLGRPELAALPERLAGDRGWAERFARIDAALLSGLDGSRARPDAEVAWAWRRLERSGGRVGVRELAAGTGWSRRHLQERFRSQIGLTPKTAARVLRFRRAAGRLAPGTLADVAADCGYADHAHLAREFRALAGCPPSQYLAEWGVPIPSSPPGPAGLRSAP